MKKLKCLLGFHKMQIKSSDVYPNCTDGRTHVVKVSRCAVCGKEAWRD